MKYLVIGAGIYGRYVASRLSQKDCDVTIIARDKCEDFQQSPTGVASLVNQARVHNGYHYPRSLTTAKKSVEHYQEFIHDFDDCVIDDFKQVYAISKHASLTNAKQFQTFCDTLGVQNDAYYPKFVNSDSIQGSWLTQEMAIDTQAMMSVMIDATRQIPLINEEIQDINAYENGYIVTTQSTSNYFDVIFNCTYAGIQQVESLIEDDKSKLTQVKYEACEIALFELPEQIERIGLTVMDGPFVSFMPFTKYLWSLTSVIDTPHYWSLDPIESVKHLTSKHQVMLQRLKQFVDESFIKKMQYVRSEYVVKTIATSAENDDNRLIHINRLRSNFISILSGKLNAIYELDELIEEICGGEN